MEKTALNKNDWEQSLAQFLSDLSAIQVQLLEVFARKRQFLVDADIRQIESIQQREKELVERLAECHDRRAVLLKQAAQQGLHADSLRTLNTSLKGPKSKTLNQQINEATSRCRMLQSHSLTNWILAMRTERHFSQILEIIATGGRLTPTYAAGDSSSVGGALVDRAA